MHIETKKQLSIEDRLAMLETEHDAQITTLRLGVAWLMARTAPDEAQVFLLLQAQEMTPAPGFPNYQNQALAAALDELADLLAAFRGLPQSAPLE